MLDYIMENKEWIFSGIGISAGGVIFLVFKYFWHRNQNIKAMPRTSSAPQTPIITGSPSQTINSDIPQDDIYRIVQEVEDMPPLHFDDVRKNYIGLNVDWLTEYHSAYKKSDDLIRVDLTAITKSFRPINVYCEVSLSEYKQFSILKRKARVRITGTISKFDSHSFWLSNVKLYFQQ